MKDWFLAAAAAAGAVAYLYSDYQMPRLQLGDPLGPRAFPAVVGVLLLISAGLLALETWRQRPVPEAPAATAKPGHTPVLLGMVAWTAAYYAAFEPVGYLIATLVYMFGLLSFFNRGRHAMNILIAAGFSGIAFGVFSQLLGVQLPPGPFGF